MGTPRGHKEIKGPPQEKTKDTEQGPPNEIPSQNMNGPRDGGHRASEVKASSRHVRQSL